MTAPTTAQASTGPDAEDAVLEALDFDATASAETEDAPADDEPEVIGSPALTVVAGALASGAASYLVASLFRGLLPRGLALLAVAGAAALVLFSTRSRRPALLQYAVLPASVLAGLALVAPFTGPAGGLTVLVREAIGAGGLGQPPAPFDPGWRFLIVVMCATLCAASCTIALASGRPKTAVLVPVPVLVAAALLQPSGQELLGFGVAAVLMVAGLAVAQGAVLAGQGQLTTAFELRRLGTGALTVVMLVGVFAGASKVDFLFPTETPERTVPPTRPELPPPAPDKVLFTVETSRSVPLRLGVIDVYDQQEQAWLLPDYDAKRLRRLEPPVALPTTPTGVEGTFEIRIRVDRMAGHALPVAAGARSLDGMSDEITFDPRTESVALAERSTYAGLTYSLVVPRLPNGRQLAQSPDPDPALSAWTQAPDAPALVKELLSTAPRDRWNRLQLLRQRLYSNVVAAGAGAPTDVSTDQVVAMMEGGEANPYAIVAAEALLARWAGVPSRIGFGYYGGDALPSGALEVHPRHGSVWLEVWFQGYGWIPVTGVPPKAKPSLGNEDQNQQNISATDELGLQTLVLVQRPNPLFYFDHARYWLVRVLPVALLLGLAVMFAPGLVKRVRSVRRRRWAARRGPRERIMVAYAELRDRMRDLAIGDPVATPLEFRTAIQPDAEHDELAWLVTRALWGDLRRDLRPSDADSAEDLARSVIRRVSKAQLLLDRVLAVSARTSLRDPYLRPAALGRAAAPAERRRAPAVRRRLLVAGAAVTVPTLVASLVVLGDRGPQPAARQLPAGLVPTTVDGLTCSRQPAAEQAFADAGSNAMVSTGEVYTCGRDEVIQGTVQLSLLKRPLDLTVRADRRDVFHGLRGDIGNGRFVRTEHGGQRYYRLSLPGQRAYVWFPDGGRDQVVLLLLLRSQYGQEASTRFAESLMDAQAATRDKEVSG